ncbi:ClpA/ClpB-like protein [Kribbella antiqua]|uniref:ClpA/ClpB-like protein n=1 Tax=Kribbella antiqua TaxID=2512217 RepID=A0A4R2J146_9ACTN|nr:Clp protease N-terminal domain-containing protein [Kribbella antiqua]TCO51457.1 ClpA/ClpB-like protein [Kribbella antiqua]
MRYLDEYDVLAVAARVLHCDSDTAVRRTNLDAVHEVLTDVRRTRGLADGVAVLLSGLVRARPFDGANRVVAVAVVLQFAALNHAELRLEPVDELDSLLDRLAEAAPDEVVAFVRDRLETVFGVSRRDEDMFEKFSDGARRVIVLAQEEAHGFQHNFIGTEHLLLGLIEEGHGAAAKVLTESGSSSPWRPAGMGISAPAVRELVVEIIGRGAQDSGGGTVPFTPRAKATLEYAATEARALGDDQLDTEHLLLGILRDGEGVGAQILVKLGGDLEDIRHKVIGWREHKQRVEQAVTGFLTEEAATTWPTFGRRHHLLAELNAVLDENEHLHEEVTRLRTLLRHHNINPDG